MKADTISYSLINIVSIYILVLCFIWRKIMLEIVSIRQKVAYLFIYIMQMTSFAYEIDINVKYIFLEQYG